MTNLKHAIVKIHDIETGEITEREMNEIEFAQYEKNEKALAKVTLDEQTKAIAKAALLEKLGITAEEAVLLLS
jgi:hypothetical protein